VLIEKDVAKEAAIAGGKSDTAQAIKKDCQEALDKVMPIYH
jgi:hypothetical protein